MYMDKLKIVTERTDAGMCRAILFQHAFPDETDPCLKDCMEVVDIMEAPTREELAALVGARLATVFSC